MKWHTIYDLSKDNRLVMQIQKATLDTTDYGILPEIALFGSPEWWDAVKDGRIPTYKVEGTISKINDNIRGAWPVCEIDSNGERTEWTRYGEDAFYQVGRRICIEYIYQRLKPSRFLKFVGDRQKVVLKVSIQINNNDDDDDDEGDYE